MLVVAMSAVMLNPNIPSLLRALVMASASFRAGSAGRSWRVVRTRSSFLLNSASSPPPILWPLSTEWIRRRLCLACGVDGVVGAFPAIFIPGLGDLMCFWSCFVWYRRGSLFICFWVLVCCLLLGLLSLLRLSLLLGPRCFLRVSCLCCHQGRVRLGLAGLCRGVCPVGGLFGFFRLYRRHYPIFHLIHFLGQRIFQGC
ncbi:hypothetical protein L873DRAFT_531521 [Choiromyces venosus 120613-1]|uniref:Uncharacterized protein n=1 Tax=Choiromyces venosus 120613-1 TaxID=1336337 RepID=A0A3N4KBA7_9PEZI|nr:hypothetical protein L873DRAFT_531521 [Choiromyces venosus 120613-1]